MTQKTDQIEENANLTELAPQTDQLEASENNRKNIAKKKHRESSNGKLSRAEKTECIRLMSRLPKYLLKNLLEELIRSETHNVSTGSSAGALTEREREVLVLVANSYTRSDIASTLGISPNTAARHITNIYRKLRISSVAEATNYAISAKLTGAESRA